MCIVGIPLTQDMLLRPVFLLESIIETCHLIPTSSDVVAILGCIVRDAFSSCSVDKMCLFYNHIKIFYHRPTAVFNHIYECISVWVFFFTEVVYVVC